MEPTAFGTMGRIQASPLGVDGGQSHTPSPRPVPVHAVLSPSVQRRAFEDVCVCVWVWVSACRVRCLSHHVLFSTLFHYLPLKKLQPVEVVEVVDIAVGIRERTVCQKIYYIGSLSLSRSLALI